MLILPVTTHPFPWGTEVAVPKAPAALVPLTMPMAARPAVPANVALSGTAGAYPMPGMSMPGKGQLVFQLLG